MIPLLKSDVSIFEETWDDTYDVRQLAEAWSNTGRPHGPWPIKYEDNVQMKDILALGITTQYTSDRSDRMVDILHSGHY